MKINLSMNINLEHGVKQCKIIQDFLYKNKNEFESILIGDLAHINQRAECYNGIEIEHLQHVSGNEYQLDYSYEWNIYNGCSDMNEHEKENDSVFFEIDEQGKIHFDLTILEERSTHNEF